MRQVKMLELAENDALQEEINVELHKLNELGHQVIKIEKVSETYNLFGSEDNRKRLIFMIDYEVNLN